MGEAGSAVFSFGAGQNRIAFRGCFGGVYPIHVESHGSSGAEPIWPIRAPRNPSGFCGLDRGPREGWEAKAVSAARAEHDSVGHLLESRCTAATSEVFETLRERAGRPVEDADVIERKSLVGLAAPFNSYLGVAVHDKVENFHILL